MPVNDVSIARPYNWLIHRQIVDELAPTLKKYAKGRLLDIGCGNKPYKYLTSEYVNEHIGLEHKDSRNEVVADIWGTAYDIPVNSSEFDTVLCNDVLEHLEEPFEALKEAFRILKDGGYAIYTMPFYWHLHEVPRDFFRYSKFGIEYLFKKAGFEIIEIMPLSGFWGNWGQMTCYYLFEVRFFQRRPFIWIRNILIQFIQRICYKKDKKYKNEKYCSEYLVVARKNAE